jgi:uncharacterized protein with PQ loop repeat
LNAIAALAIATFTIPQLVSILKTKQTVGINIAMYTIFLIGCFFFILNAIGLITNVNKTLLPTGILLLITNIFCCISGGIIYYIKIRNLLHAKKNNMTEADYCQSLLRLKKTTNIFAKKHDDILDGVSTPIES